jgi:hypothetical protein
MATSPVLVEGRVLDVRPMHTTLRVTKVLKGSVTEGTIEVGDSLCYQSLDTSHWGGRTTTSCRQFRRGATHCSCDSYSSPRKVIQSRPVARWQGEHAKCLELAPNLEHGRIAFDESHDADFTNDDSDSFSL